MTHWSPHAQALRGGSLRSRLSPTELNGWFPSKDLSEISGYPPKNERMSRKKGTILVGNISSNHWFSGDMLISRRVFFCRKTPSQNKKAWKQHVVWSLDGNEIVFEWIEILMNHGGLVGEPKKFQISKNVPWSSMTFCTQNQTLGSRIRMFFQPLTLDEKQWRSCRPQKIIWPKESPKTSHKPTGA